MIRFSSLVLVAAICGAIAPGAASAQLTPSFNVQQFVPAASYHEFVAVDSARMAPALTPSFDLVFNYSHRNLQQRDPNFDRLFGVIDGVVGGDFRLGFAFTNWLDVSVNFPFMQLTFTGEGLEGFGKGLHYALGDLGLQFKVAPLNADRMPIGLAIIPFVTFPTGRPRLYASDGTVTFGGKVALSKRWEYVHFALHVGYMVKPGHATVGNSFSAGDEIPYGVAVGFSPVPKWLDINVELMGAGMIGAGRLDVPENAPKAILHAPMELLANLRLRTPVGLDVVLGGGPGLTPGAGTPQFRVFAGLSWAVAEGSGDKDRDGILVPADQCPNEPEDMDGFEDTDGCPDDNDGDGIADADDRCPSEPEDLDGWVDADGCPDPDNDEDGVLDADDKCPVEAEDIDAFEDEDGCPEENDGDGIPDKDDQCPDEPEDVDGFQDTDGCPDPDNDEDGVLDVDDLCPDQPENINGKKDEDGCPDEIKAVVRGEKIVILDKVFFVSGKDQIISKSFPVLDAVTTTLVDNPLITRIRVEGHTDSRGDDAFNQTLSDKRAAAVMRYLVGKGVEPERLESAGFGETRPIDTNDTDAGRQNNRRVEFTILAQTPKQIVVEEVPVEEAPAEEAPAEEAPAEEAPAEEAPAEEAPAGKKKGKK